MTTTCARCGTDFPRAATGRPARYCSGRCRVAAHREHHAVPAVMRDARRWVRADGKRPITTTGRPASSTNPRTWSTYEDARRSTAGDGFGVMLGGGLGCYDLDHVTDEQVREFAATIPEPIVFAERSLSGDGAHIFVLAPEAPGRRAVQSGVSIEKYTRARFIRTTLDRLAL